MLELRDGTRTNWQVSITYTDLHKINPKWLVHSYNTFGARTSHGQLRLTIFTRAQTWGEATTFPLIVYSAALHGGHIQMTFCPKTPKWMSQPHFGLNVRVKPTLPKVGTWSPPGLPKTQSPSWRGKTPCIGVFFVTLERYWSVNV